MTHSLVQQLWLKPFDRLPRFPPEEKMLVDFVTESQKQRRQECLKSFVTLNCVCRCFCVGVVMINASLLVNGFQA